MVMVSIVLRNGDNGNDFFFNNLRHLQLKIQEFATAVTNQAQV